MTNIQNSQNSFYDYFVSLKGGIQRGEKYPPFGKCNSDARGV